MRTCDEHFLSLFLDWSTRNRVLFPRSYHLGECRRSLRAETGGTCREYERGRLSSGFSAASRRGPGASSNHANGPFPFRNLFSKISPKNIYQSSLEITRTWFQGIFLNFHRWNSKILFLAKNYFLDIRNLSRMELFSIELVSMKSKIFFWREREKKIILPREELVFGYTKTVMNGTNFRSN